MTKTTLDLATRAARDRGILEATESLEGRDYDYIKGVYLADLEELKEREIAYWPANEIPDAVMRGLSARLGLLISDAFGFPKPAEAEIEASLRPLRIHVSKRHTGETTESCYF